MNRLVKGVRANGSDVAKILNDERHEPFADPERRISAELDSDGRVLSYRDSGNVLHEETGIRTPFVSADRVEFGSFAYPPQAPASGDLAYVEKPAFAEFYFTGQFPNGGASSVLDLDVRVNNQSVLRCAVSAEIQGHGSKQYAKKNYTLDFKNSAGNDMKVKFGTMPAVDSLHYKGYMSDRTHCRDVGGARLWRRMVASLDYPWDELPGAAVDMSSGQKEDALFTSDAEFCPDGFPTAAYLNGEFYGVYTLKLKKSRENYAMEKSNSKEIFLDSLGIDENPNFPARLDEAFDPRDWDVKNPKIKGYEAGGEITDESVRASVESLFDWTSSLSEGTKGEWAEHVVLPHWITWLEFCELVGHWDTSGNNLELLTWDGAHWSISPYDFDQTLGIVNGRLDLSHSGFMAGGSFFSKFRSLFGDEIKAAWKRLRESGTVALRPAYECYRSVAAAIPRDAMEADRKKWDNIYGDVWPTLGQIRSYLESRLEFLDSQWL